MTNDVSIPAEDIVQIYDLLYRLGVTANHAGFFHTAYAVYLAAKQSDRLLLAAKWIYPKVARHYGITGYCAVRSIDMASRTAWLTNRALLEELTSWFRCALLLHPVENHKKAPRTQKAQVWSPTPKLCFWASAAGTEGLFLRTVHPP